MEFLICCLIWADIVTLSENSWTLAGLAVFFASGVQYIYRVEYILLYRQTRISCNAVNCNNTDTYNTTNNTVTCM